MCTLTFSPTRTGYLLAMNRDEQRSRQRALPPRWHQLGVRSALYPRESGGGTWIGLNDTGISFALLNWYSVPLRSLSHPLSRGIVIPALLHGTTSDAADSLLRQLETDRLQPFRLVGIFPWPGSPAVHEWRWDGKQIEKLEWGWQRGHWISSAKDEIRAQRTRSACFQSHEAEADAGGDAWLQRLYASHEPEEGPYSICMHREDAVTVSHTRIEVQGGHGRMRYVDGPPCQCRRTESRDLVSYEAPAEAGSFWQWPGTWVGRGTPPIE